MATSLSVQHLKFRYHPGAQPSGLSPWVLEDVCFEVPEGGFLGLVGPNGAGKSTLMSIIASLNTPTEGAVHFPELTRLTGMGGDPRNYVALAPQEIALYPSLTAVENLKFFGQLGSLGTNELSERIAWCLDFVSLAGQKDMRIAEYSGGMKRRLNLAAALINRPRILELDEPTVGVDPQSRSLILEALKKLNGLGTTILYSSHYLEEVEKNCKQLVLIDRGKILYAGGVSEFQRTGSLEKRFMDVTGSEMRD